MELQQQPVDAIHDRLVEMFGIGALILFGVISLFLGWLKYKSRNNPAKASPRKRTTRRKKRK